MTVHDMAAAAEAFGMERLADGVWGWRFDRPDYISIPIIEAERPGTGDVGKFLDTLPRDRRVIFPTVISGRLAAMLEHRGFIYNEAAMKMENPEPDPEYDADPQYCDGWVREPVT